MLEMEIRHFEPLDYYANEAFNMLCTNLFFTGGDIKKIIDGMPAYDEIYAAMERLGAKMTLAELGVDPDVVNTAMHCAKDYRTRYSLFKTLDELGLLETYIADYPMSS